MLVIPLLPVPAQVVNVILGEQFTRLTLRQLASGLFINVAVDAVDVAGLVICQNLNRIVRDAYLGFVGDLMFVDNFDENGKPSEDPYYTGLGSHFSLLYLSPEEL